MTWHILIFEELYEQAGLCLSWDRQYDDEWRLRWQRAYEQLADQAEMQHVEVEEPFWLDIHHLDHHRLKLMESSSSFDLMLCSFHQLSQVAFVVDPTTMVVK